MKIIDDEEYEKNKAFAIELGEPVLLEIGQKHGGWVGRWVGVAKSAHSQAFKHTGSANG